MKLIRSPSTNTPTPSIYSLITDGVHTARRHWVVIRGKSWLSNGHRCRQIVTKRILNLRHRVAQQELVSLVTTKMIAIRATPQLGLVLQGILIITTSVETKHNLFRTTDIKKHIKTMGYGLVQQVSSQTVRNLGTRQLDISIKLCLFKRQVENVVSSSNNQKPNALQVFRNDFIKHHSSSEIKKVSFCCTPTY